MYSTSTERERNRCRFSAGGANGGKDLSGLLHEYFNLSKKSCSFAQRKQQKVQVMVGN